MLRAQVDQETTPNNTSALRSRGGRHQNVSGGATRDSFTLRSEPASESEQDPEEGGDEALAAGPAGFAEVLTPLAGQMAFEIVTALFANYREMESAYADLKRMHARIRTSDKKEWHGILTDLIAFMRKCAPLLPDMAQSRVKATCGALEQVDQLWTLCDSIREVMNRPELAWYDRPGLIATELRKCESAAAYLPDSFAKWLAYASEAQEQFTASLQAIRYFKRELSSAESGGLAMIAAIASILDNKAFKLPQPLRNFLHALPRTSDDLQAYRCKVDSLLTRFNELSQVGSIADGLASIQKLVSAGLIDMQGLSVASDSLLDTASKVGQWYGDLTELRAILGATLEARNANDALAQVSKLLNLHSLKPLLGDRLVESLRTATATLAGLSESVGAGQGVYGRLTAIVHGDEPLRQKLTEVSRLISKTPQIPEGFRASLAEVTDTLDKLSAVLSFHPMDSKTHMLKQIAEALHALKTLTGNPFVQRSLGSDASRHSQRVIGTMAQALNIMGLLERLLRGDATFEAFVNGLMNMQGEGNALSEALERLSGFADSVLQSLEPVESKAGKLSALLRWLAHPEAEKLILSGVPVQYKDTTLNAVRLYQQISAFPATGSWDSQRAWLREHLVNGDTLHQLIGANDDMVTRWRSLVGQNDAVIALLKRFLPLINGDKLTFSDIRSVLCSREGLGAAQQALSASVFHMESTVAYGIGTVVDQGIGLGLAWTDEDEATRRSMMESAVNALDNISRSTVARYLGAANPGVAVLADALYSVLLAPMMKKVPGAFAEHLTTAERQSCKSIAKALARTLLSASPSAEEFRENARRFALDSPALSGLIRTGAGIVQQIGSHVWEIHLALDVYLLIRAEPSKRAERIQALTTTLATLREHGYEWAGPLATLAPLLPDLDEARKLLKRELPQADSWFEWSVALSPMLAESKAPSIVRLRQTLAGSIATSLRGGFHRLVELGFSEQVEHHVRADAEARLNAVEAKAHSLHAALALAPKAGAAAGPLFRQVAQSLASIPLIRSALAWPGGAQSTEVCLIDSPLVAEYEHHGVQLSEEDRAIMAGMPEVCGVYHRGARRYIRVDGRTFGLVFDKHFDILRLVKPGESEQIARMSGPAIAFHDGRWFITEIHKTRGGADADETLNIEMARFEADKLMREIHALLDTIEAGTYPFAEIEALTYQLSDFQLTCGQLKAAVEALEQPPGPWTGTYIGSGLAMLGLLALIYYWYTSRSPFQLRRSAPADSNGAQTQSGEGTPLVPMSADGHYAVELPVEPEPESMPRREKYDRFPQIAGVVLLFSGGVVVLEAWAGTWLRRDQANADLAEQSVVEPQADSSTAHQLAKRAVEQVGAERERSALAKYLDDYDGWKLDDVRVSMPDNIDNVLCVYADKTYFITVDEKFWKITKPQRVRFSGNPFQIEPSIRYSANLVPRKDYFTEVVYTESLGWRFVEKWEGGTYPERTPAAPLRYLERSKSQDRSRPPSYWLDAFLSEMDQAAVYSGSGKPERKNHDDPKRVFYTPRFGSLIKANQMYWPLTWWKIRHPDADPSSTFTAAGHVTYGTSDGDKALIVYDEKRGWMLAVFANNHANIFDSLDAFKKFRGRYFTKIEPLLLPSKKSLVDQVIERRFAEADAVPLYVVGLDLKHLGHRVYYVNKVSGASVSVKAYYYHHGNRYWLIKLEKSDHESGAFASRDLTYHGHFEYTFEGRKCILHVVYSETKGLLPSALNDQGTLDEMRDRAGANNTTASVALLDLARTFGSGGSYGGAGRKQGQDGNLYYDFLDESASIWMFVGREYWPFELSSDSEGVLHASFRDGSRCDVLLCLVGSVWVLKWEEDPARSWFTECLRIIMAQGRIGVRLIREASKKWADRPLMNAAETMAIVSACLNSLEVEYRSAKASEKWRSVIILTAQLSAFFAREVESGDLRLEFSRQIIGQLGKIGMQEDVAEGIDTSIMDDAAGSADSINAIQEIDAALVQVDEQMKMLSRAIEETTYIKANADYHFYGKPLQVLGGPLSVKKVPMLFDLLLDWLFKWNDLTHDWVWAGDYLAWLNEAMTQLEKKKKLLQDRRDHLGSTELYERIFNAYQAGIAEGKRLEEKYAFAIDWRTGADEVNRRMLWAQYSGALAELALGAQRRRKAGVSWETANAETEAARYYCWMRFSEAARFQELLGAISAKIKSKKIKPKGRYTDLMDCILAAQEIIGDENSDGIEFVTTDLALLAMSIHAISTSPQSVEDLRGRDYNSLRLTFLEKSQSLHPFALLPKKPDSYSSMAEIKPSSLFGSGDERYVGYNKQFSDYRSTGLPYDAGVVVQTGLENVQLGSEMMYDVKAVVHLDIDWVGVTARANLIQLSDDSCLFYFFVIQPAVAESSATKQRQEVVDQVKNWNTKMEWLPKIPSSTETVKEYSSALKTMRPFMVKALSNLTIEPGHPGIYFGTVKHELLHVRYHGMEVIKLETTEAKISPPADAVISTELVPYLLKDTERNLSETADLLYSSMLELSPKDKWIGFFVVFYSQIRKATLDKNYRVDRVAILIDATTVLLNVVPWARASVQILKRVGLGAMWKAGVNTGLHGRKLIAHVASQIPLKSVMKISREFAALVSGLFLPITFPLNPLALNFRGLISKSRLIVKTRSSFEVFSDTRSVKAFLDSAVLPPTIAALAKVPVTPRDGVQRVGPDLYRNDLTFEVGDQLYSIYYIKVGDLYYQIGWEANFGLATLDDFPSPFPIFLRRRFADWHESTAAQSGGSGVSPKWAGTGLERTSVQARDRVTELRRAKSDALAILRHARAVATSDAQDIQTKVKQAFQIFWNDASPATIHSFATNLSNVIDFLSGISVSSDVVFLGDKTGSRLSAMPGSAFDIAQTYDVTAAISGEDVDAEHKQRADAITGPGFINEAADSALLQYATRTEVIPLAMRDDNFELWNYDFYVTAYLVRQNEFCQSVIREGFVATTKNKRVARQWTALMAAKPDLSKLSAEDKQVFLDQLSLTYNLFLFEGQPVEARPLAAFVNARSQGWDKTGEEVGVDISSLLRTQRTPSKEESATAARAADPDLFSFLVIVLSDLKADPPRFEDFTTRAANAKPGEQVMWKWFKGEPSA